MELRMELAEICQERASQIRREKDVLAYIKRCERNRKIAKAKEIAITTILAILVAAAWIFIGCVVGTPELQDELRESLPMVMEVKW